MYQRECSSRDGRKTGHAEPESLTGAESARAPARARGATPRPLASASRPSRISASRSGSGTSFAAPPRLKNPLLSGSRLVPPTSTRRRLSPLAARAARSAWSCACAAASPAGSIAPTAGAADAAAEVRSALDGARRSRRGSRSTRRGRPAGCCAPCAARRSSTSCRACRRGRSRGSPRRRSRMRAPAAHSTSKRAERSADVVQLESQCDASKRPGGPRRRFQPMLCLVRRSPKRL